MERAASDGRGERERENEEREEEEGFHFCKQSARLAQPSDVCSLLNFSFFYL
jgi:hypothetical protein